jgi:flagellar hook-length control protein FliK
MDNLQTTSEVATEPTASPALRSGTDESILLDAQEKPGSGPEDALATAPAVTRSTPATPIGLSNPQSGIQGVMPPAAEPSPFSNPVHNSSGTISRSDLVDQLRPASTQFRAHDPGPLPDASLKRVGSGSPGIHGSDQRTEVPAGSVSGTPSDSAPSTLAVGSALNAAPAPNETFPVYSSSGVTAAGPQDTPLRNNGTFDSQAPAGYTSDRIDQPIHDTSFPRVLGLKIGQWIQDGVQQVWLDVHPADMGPVAISIALDGQQAELNFGAESANARQAIESSLPELAAALQNAGLTLSGGSISQQLAQSQSQEGKTTSSTLSGNHPGKGRASATSAADPMPLRRAVGLLDLYA